MERRPSLRFLITKNYNLKAVSTWKHHCELGNIVIELQISFSHEKLDLIFICIFPS